MSKGVLAPLEQLVRNWKDRFGNPTFAVETWGAWLMCAEELEAVLAALPGLGGPQEPTNEELLAEWDKEVKEHGIWTSGHSIGARMAKALRLALSVPAPQEPAHRK